MNSKEKEQIDKKTSRKILLSILFLTILVISVISISFATFQQTDFDNNPNSITTGKVSMTYTEDTNGISIVNALPMSDTVGKTLKGKGEYFDFTINSTISGKAHFVYEIAAIKDSSSTVPDSNIKLYLEQQKSGTYESVMEPTNFKPISQSSEVGSPVGSMILKSVQKNSTGADNYRLRMWIDEKAPTSQALTYTVRINVYAKAQ